MLSRKDSWVQKGSKPDKVALVCFDMEGTYLPDLELWALHCVNSTWNWQRCFLFCLMLIVKFVYDYWKIFFCRISCHCGPCKGQKFLFNEWERHAGCRSKNWRSSIKLKGSLMPFGKWVCTVATAYFYLLALNNKQWEYVIIQTSLYLCFLCFLFLCIKIAKHFDLQIDKHQPGVCPTNPSKRSSQKMKKQKLIDLLNGIRSLI